MDREPRKDPDKTDGSRPTAKGEWTHNRGGPLVLATAGIEFGFVIVIMTLGGWWIDGKLGISPALLITGACVGTIGGIYNFWRKGKRFFDQK